jgi:hypothetical protein
MYDSILKEQVILLKFNAPNKGGGKISFATTVYQLFKVWRAIAPSPFIHEVEFYGSIYCPVSKGYKDIWIRLCFDTIVTSFFIAAQF